MRRRLAAALLACLAPAGSGAAGAAAVKEQRPGRSTDQPRPRDGNVAIRQELDAARRAGTLAAYDLFLERHSGHPLAETARRERAAIAAAAKPGL
jgi:hypothetical protein